MNQIRYLGGVALVFVLGCQGMPTVTRTGDVKDIMIGDSLTSGYIAVGPGDEVRWINKRTAPVRIVFLDPEWDQQLSCKNNFGGWMTRSDTAQLATNETASVCFRDAGTFRYTVRMESDRATGDLNVPGVVKVGGQGGQAVGQTSDQNLNRTSDQPSDPLSGPGPASDQLNDQTGRGISDQPSGPTSGPTGSTSTTTTTTTTMPAQ
jgi:hypothetical protein